VVAGAVVAFGATSLAAGASTQLTKPQYIAKGDAICATAIRQIKQLGPLSGRAGAAAYGSRWLTIDRRTLAGLRRLSAPAADRAKIAALLQLADVAINKGVAPAVSAAKSGSSANYQTAARRAAALINRAHAAARAYGFSACARW
jgi:hypothetical protein